MAKNKKENKNYLWIVGIVIIIVVISYFYQLPRKQPQTTNLSTTKPNEATTHTSKLLKISINVSKEFKIEDGGVSINLTSNEGKVSIIRNGTQFINLESYLDEFDRKRSLIVVNKKEANLEGIQASSRIIKFPQQNVTQKSYYIYKDYSVYIISTQSEALFDDLDQIAQSFRYSP